MSHARSRLARFGWALWSVPTAIALGGALVAVGRTGSSTSWLELAGLAAVLLIATAAMHGVSRGRRDGADRFLFTLTAASLVALVVSVAWSSTPMARLSTLVESLGLLAAIVAGAGAITSYLGYAFYMAFHFEGTYSAEEDIEARR